MSSVFLLVLGLVTPLCPTLCDPLGCTPPGPSVHGDSPGKNTGVGCSALLQRIFPTQGLNPGLPHCGWILYHLSPQGSPRILEWVAYHFSRGSSQPRNWTRVSCIAGRFFTSWATWEAPGVFFLDANTSLSRTIFHLCFTAAPHAPDIRMCQWALQVPQYFSRLTSTF